MRFFVVVELQEINLADREKLKSQFLKRLNLDQYNITPIDADASYRKYYRISQGDSSFIIMDSIPSYENNKAFVQIAKHLTQNALSAPNIYNYDEQNGFLIIEDFGDVSLSKLLTNVTKYSSYRSVEEVYHNCVDMLMTLHKADPMELPYYTDETLLRELRMFTDCYIPAVTGEYLSQSQIDTYLTSWKSILKFMRIFDDVLVLRDFHVDNLFYLEKNDGLKKIGVIDFQDGVIGSPIYDIVSLLEDARCDVSQKTVESSINYYLDKNPDITRKDFLAVYNILGAQRNSHILGVFAKKAMDGDSRYMKYVPRAKKYLDSNLMHPLLMPLKNWIDKNLSI
jgi:aminoglycoside/choline kinase family phosphotransferase